MAVATLLETTGWTSLLTSCPTEPLQFWTISAFRPDDYGYVTITVYLIPPGGSFSSDPYDGWIGQASIDAGFAREAAELGPPQADPDLDCLH